MNQYLKSDRALFESLVETRQSLSIAVVGAVLLNSAGECIGVTPEPAYGWVHLNAIMRKHFGAIALEAGLEYRECGFVEDRPTWGFNYEAVGALYPPGSHVPVSKLYARPYEECAADYAKAQAVKRISRDAWKAGRYLSTCEPVQIGTATVSGECVDMRKLRAKTRAAYSAGNEERARLITDLMTAHYTDLPCAKKQD